MVPCHHIQPKMNDIITIRKRQMEFDYKFNFFLVEIIFNLP